MSCEGNPATSPHWVPASAGMTLFGGGNLVFEFFGGRFFEFVEAIECLNRR